MKALSVRQPWAHLIIHGGRTVESRSWRTSHRGNLLIHAARDVGQREYAAARKFGIDLDAVPYGGIIGRVRLVDIVQDSESPWAVPGLYHWILEAPEPLPFIWCTGRFGVFERNLPAEVLRKVRA